MLKRIFVSRDTDLWKKQYTSMIKPHLEYAVQVGTQDYQIHDIDYIKGLEKLQRMASKIPTKLSKLSHDQRLAEIGLAILKDRRVRGELQSVLTDIDARISCMQDNVTKFTN